MIVQCVRCETRFQLDETRVPAGGVRVRCSRCKESFFLPHPSSTQSDVVHGIAEQAVQQTESPAPEPTRDLTASSEFFEGEAEVVAERDNDESVAAGAGPGSGGISEDEDWQFNEETPEAEAAPVLEDEAEAAACFGSVDDFSSLIEEVAPAFEPTPAGEALVGAELETDELESVELATTGLESVELATAGLEAPVSGIDSMDVADDALAAPPRADQDLGDPEDWNFFSDSPSSGYQPPPTVTAPAAVSSATIAAEPLVDGGSNEASEKGAARGTSRSGLAGAVGAGVARVGTAAGWLITLSLVAFGIFQGLVLKEVQAQSPAAPLALGALVVDGLVPSWIETRDQGRILAVRGRLSNPTSRPLAQQETLLVTLLDGAGNPLATPALGALSLSEASIRELPRDQLAGAQARAAGALARATLAPGQSLAFTALFDEVPDATRRFALQTAPATPAIPAAQPWQEPAPAAAPANAPLPHEDSGPADAIPTS